MKKFFLVQMICLLFCSSSPLYSSEHSFLEKVCDCLLVLCTRSQSPRLICEQQSKSQSQRISGVPVVVGMSSSPLPYSVIVNPQSLAQSGGGEFPKRVVINCIRPAKRRPKFEAPHGRLYTIHEEDSDNS